MIHDIFGKAKLFFLLWCFLIEPWSDINKKHYSCDSAIVRHKFITGSSYPLELPPPRKSGSFTLLPTVFSPQWNVTRCFFFVAHMSLPGLGITMCSSSLTLQGTSARSRDFVPIRSDRWRKVPREDMFSCVWIDNYITSIWYVIHDTYIDICIFVYILIFDTYTCFYI